MASNDDGGVIGEDSCKTKESSSTNNETLTNLDLQSFLMKIKANVAQISQVLASLVAERSSNSFEFNENDQLTNPLRATAPKSPMMAPSM